MLSGAKLIVRHIFEVHKISEAVYFHSDPYYLRTYVLPYLMTPHFAHIALYKTFFNSIKHD